MHKDEHDLKAIKCRHIVWGWGWGGGWLKLTQSPGGELTE